MPSQSESLSQSPSPFLQSPLPPSLQHSSLPSFCHHLSFLGAHGRWTRGYLCVLHDLVASEDPKHS